MIHFEHCHTHHAPHVSEVPEPATAGLTAVLGLLLVVVFLFRRSKLDA